MAKVTVREGHLLGSAFLSFTFHRGVAVCRSGSDLGSAVWSDSQGVNHGDHEAFRVRTVQAGGFWVLNRCGALAASWPRCCCPPVVRSPAGRPWLCVQTEAAGSGLRWEKDEFILSSSIKPSSWQKKWMPSGAQSRRRPDSKLRRFFREIFLNWHATVSFVILFHCVLDYKNIRIWTVVTLCALKTSNCVMEKKKDKKKQTRRGCDPKQSPKSSWNLFFPKHFPTQKQKKKSGNKTASFLDLSKALKMQEIMNLVISNPN